MSSDEDFLAIMANGGMTGFLQKVEDTLGTPEPSRSKVKHIPLKADGEVTPNFAAIEYGMDAVGQLVLGRFGGTAFLDPFGNLVRVNMSNVPGNPEIPTGVVVHVNGARAVIPSDLLNLILRRMEAYGVGQLPEDDSKNWAF